MQSARNTSRQGAIFIPTPTVAIRKYPYVPPTPEGSKDLQNEPIAVVELPLRTAAVQERFSSARASRFGYAPDGQPAHEGSKDLQNEPIVVVEPPHRTAAVQERSSSATASQPGTLLIFQRAAEEPEVSQKEAVAATEPAHRMAVVELPTSLPTRNAADVPARPEQPGASQQRTQKTNPKTNPFWSRNLRTARQPPRPICADVSSAPEQPEVSQNPPQRVPERPLRTRINEIPILAANHPRAALPRSAPGHGASALAARKRLVRCGVRLRCSTASLVASGVARAKRLVGSDRFVQKSCERLDGAQFGPS